MQTEVSESPATMDDLDNSTSQPASRGFTLGQHSKFTDQGTDAGQAPSGDMVSAILASTELPGSAETLANTVWSDGSGDDLAAVQDTSTQMEREIAKRQRELRTLAGEMIRKSDQAAGVIEFSEASRVRPLSHPIPLWMAASVLLLGVFSAASASWVQQRLHAGGVYDPRQLVATLRQAGLPVVDMVELSSDWETPNGMLSRMRLRASQTARRIASNMTLACEWVLWFWVYTLAIRLVLDSMWRQVLFDNPLAALGRILWGLP